MAVLREDCPDFRNATALRWFRADGHLGLASIGFVCCSLACLAARRLRSRVRRATPRRRCGSGGLRTDRRCWAVGNERPGRKTDPAEAGLEKTKTGDCKLLLWLSLIAALSQALEQLKVLSVAPHSYLVLDAPTRLLSVHFQSSLLPARSHDRLQRVARRRWR